MFERPDSGDRALLVHIDIAQYRANLNRQAGKSSIPPTDLEDERAEFVDLATSAGLEVLDMVVGSRSKPMARHFIGKGKIEEIQLALAENEADVVLFGQTLSPSQERNLEKELKVRVLDRNS
ncbi:MAG: GTP-binding protein HflX, partial [Pseudomonadales bacterium]